MKRTCRRALTGLVCLALFLAGGGSGFCLEGVDVTVTEGKVSVKATRTPLQDILKALSEKGGVTVKANSSLTVPLSFDFSGLSIEESIRQLLADWNYVLFQRKTTTGAAGEYILWIYARKPGTPPKALSSPPPIAWPPALEVSASGSPAGGGAPQPPKMLSRSEFAEIFSDEGAVELQLTAESPVDYSPEDGGILVSDVHPDSALAGLGIANGDLITYINGSPIRSAQDLARQLSPEAVDERPLVMIQRSQPGQDGSATTTDTIYIHLQD